MTKEPPFCFLMGESAVEFCPEATDVGNDIVYWTNDHNDCKKSDTYIKKYCTCAYYKDNPKVGPHCSTWSEGQHPFCLLAGRSEGRFCPGAMKFPGTDIYFTEDKATCKKSRASIWSNCSCVWRPENDMVGPFCSNWSNDNHQYCYLSGGLDGKFCPGAVLSQLGLFYITDDKDICTNSVRNPTQIT